VWDRRGKPRLTLKRILKWCDAHYNLHGRWPVTLSGPVHGAPGEDWAAIDMALRDGRRGLAGGSSLARLLEEERHVPAGKGRADLSVDEVRGMGPSASEAHGALADAEIGDRARRAGRELGRD